MAKKLILFIVILVIFSINLESEVEMGSLPDDNLKYPVILDLVIKNQTIPVGSGFFLNSNKSTYLITAKHVIFAEDGKLISNVVQLSAYPKDPNVDEPIEIELNLEELNKNNLILVHPSRDVVALKVGGKVDEKSIKFVEGISKKRLHPSGIVGVDINSVKQFKDVVVGNDVFVFGYPVSLQGKEVAEVNFRKPLLRKGIIAGKDITNLVIILDCFVNKGNSGGLVIEVTQEGLGFRFRAIGIVTKFIPFIDRLKSNQYSYENIQVENSGYSIVTPMDFILELIKE